MAWTIITGATGSMGSVAAQTLAAEGRQVILACRNLEKGRRTMDRIMEAVPGAVLELRELNLASQASVRAFAASLEGMEIEALFNNAGTMMRHYRLTEDGIEESVAVNFLNLALLSFLVASLMPKGGRIVNMVSVSTSIASFHEDWASRGPEHFGQLSTYAMSKLLLLNFSVAFARHNPDLIVNVSDPGVVNSNMIHMNRWYDPLADIFFRPFISSPEKGVQPALRALKATESLHYYVGGKSGMIRKKYLNSNVPELLWKQSREMLCIR